VLLVQQLLVVVMLFSQRILSVAPIAVREFLDQNNAKYTQSQVKNGSSDTELALKLKLLKN
jgi:hypothetical protein